MIISSSQENTNRQRLQLDAADQRFDALYKQYLTKVYQSCLSDTQSGFSATTKELFLVSFPQLDDQEQA